MLHVHKIGEHFGVWDPKAQQYLAGAVDVADMHELLLRRGEESVAAELPRLIAKAVRQGCSEDAACNPIPPLWMAPGLSLSMDVLAHRLLGAGRHNALNPCASPEEVAFSEEQIGVPLPADYHEFLTTVSNGAVLYMGSVLVGAGPQAHHPAIIPIQVLSLNWAKQMDLRSLPDAVEVRTGGSIPRSSLVPFSPDSNGNVWCFSLSDGALYYWNEINDTLYGKTDSFMEWLALLARFEDEVIRSICPRAIIHYELCLG